jgi:hypothetical protein
MHLRIFFHDFICSVGLNILWAGNWCDDLLHSPTQPLPGWRKYLTWLGKAPKQSKSSEKLFLLHYLFSLIFAFLFLALRQIRKFHFLFWTRWFSSHNGNAYKFLSGVDVNSFQKNWLPPDTANIKVLHLCMCIPASFSSSQIDYETIMNVCFSTTFIGCRGRRQTNKLFCNI